MSWRWSGVLAVGLAVSGALAADDELAPPAPTVSVELQPGFETYSRTGSAARAGQYVLPYSGPTLSILNFDLRNRERFDLLDIWVHDFGSHRFDTRLDLWCNFVPAVFRAEWERAAFTNEPLAPAPLHSHRSRYGFEGRVYPLPGLRVSGYWDDTDVGQPSQLREGPLTYGVQRYGFDVVAPVFGGSLGLDYDAREFRDRNLGGGSSHTQQLGLAYSQPLGTRWQLGGTARWATIRQPARPTSELFVGRFDLAWQPSSNLWTRARLEFRDVDLGPTATGYVSEQVTGGMRLTWRPLRPLRLTGGVDLSAYERFDAVQAAVDRPGAWRIHGRADYRGPNSLRASLAYQQRRVTNLNPTAAPLVADARALLIDEDRRLDLRASGLFGEAGVVYGSYQFRQRSLNARALEHTVHTLGGGVTLPVTDWLNLATDLTWTDFNTNAGILAGAAGDVLTAHLGLDFALAKKWRLATDYHLMEGNSGPNADSDTFTAALTGDFGRGHSLRVQYGREDYTSAVFGALGYGLDRLDIRYTATF